MNGQGKDALSFLKEVEEKAKELYALSDQGRWDDLAPAIQAMWINHAGRILRGDDG